MLLPRDRSRCLFLLLIGPDLSTLSKLLTTVNDNLSANHRHHIDLQALIAARYPDKSWVWERNSLPD